MPRRDQIRTDQTAGPRQYLAPAHFHSFDSFTDRCALFLFGVFTTLHIACHNYGVILIYTPVNRVPTYPHFSGTLSG